MNVTFSPFQVLPNVNNAFFKAGWLSASMSICYKHCPHAIKSKGRLKPPLRFMYCLYFLFSKIWESDIFVELSVFFPFVVSKLTNPIILYISWSSSVKPCNVSLSSSFLSTGTFWEVSGLSISIISTDLDLLLRRGEIDLLLLGDRDRDLLCLLGDLEWLLCLSLLLLSLSLEVDLLLSLLGDLDLLLVILSSVDLPFTINKVEKLRQWVHKC